MASKEEKTAYGDLFIQYEKVLICRICGKVIHRFGHGSRNRDPHAEKHFKEGKITGKRVQWHNDSRWEFHYFLKDGVETIDRETLNLIKSSVMEDPRLVYPRPDIECPIKKCPVCGGADFTAYTNGRTPTNSYTFRVDGWICDKCDRQFNRNGQRLR